MQTIVAAIGDAADVEGSALAGAVASAQAETDNNYLGRRQLLAQARELAECKGNVGCQVAVYARYSAISFAQDGAIIAGIPLGAGEQVVADVQGLIELIKNPRAAYDAVKALATDPQVRRQLGAAVLADIDAKLAVFNRATEYGGLENSVAAGQVIGSVAITLAGATTGAYSAAKAATKIATVGAKLTKGSAAAVEAALAARRATAAAEKAAIAARAKAIREGNTLAARADAEAGQAAPISTAKADQSVVPRDLAEYILFKQVESSPELGLDLNLNRDKRFPRSGGWQKMQATTRSKTTNKSVTIHYQYNAARGIVVDIKVVTPQLQK
ncbi:hypothetical protein [Sphingomonas albertensis]|uniref:Toxin CdiA n=1 Tax=Sphingomonas albertensis TaxID=2762591 RepID=A0ABR7AI20_9SPHN|nr:hypothetical protein [Sphingomonas albertensis]MBC3940099.1 hypothetical protein [Sphingomonas albertensis]